MDYVIDATNQKLGRLASKISQILQGKLNADYEPRLVGNDRVIIKNISKIVVTGKKSTQKIYYRHTGYMGHLKSRTLEQVFEKNPAGGLRLAVERMRPKNFLQQKRMKRLIIK